MKTCGTCKQLQSLQEFTARRGSADGRRNNCRSCSRQQYRKWLLAHSEKNKEKCRQWYLANTEKAKERHRQWHLANTEKVKETNRQWRLANPEKAKEKSRRWRLANGEQKAVHALIHANSHLTAPDKETRQEIIAFIRDNQPDTCPYCPVKLIYNGADRNVHLDHILPRKRWPKLTFTPSNLQWLCGKCNLEKGSRTPQEFLEHIKKQYKEKLPKLEAILNAGTTQDS